MDSNLSKHFGSVRSAHSYDRHISSQRTASSFVTINEKRSWRPPPYLFQPVLDFMSNAAPLALAAANPFLRLYVERNEEGGGFMLEGYQVTPILLGEHQCRCEDRDNSEVGYDVVSNTNSGGGLPSLEGDSRIRTSGSCFYSGPCRGTSGMVVEDDDSGGCWGEEEELSLHEEDSEPHLNLSNSNSAGGMAGRVVPFFIHGIGTTQGMSSWSGHRYPWVGVDRVLPTSTQAVSRAFKSHTSLAVDERDRSCLRECWLGAAAELSLCVRIVCKSHAALQFSALGAWWLSRYYGVSLRLHHMHPAQLPAFKTVQRSLFIKELQFENCTLSEDFLQCISTCVDLLALSIFSCSASQDVALQSIDPILRKGTTSECRPVPPSSTADTAATGGVVDSRNTRSGSPSAHLGSLAASMRSSPPPPPRRDTTNWYLAGVRSLGQLRRLKCLHILHTPLHETFLQALSTCSALECLILHRCRGVRSLEPLPLLAHLESLSLHGLAITDNDVLSLGACPSLRQLVIDECRNVTDLSFLTRLHNTLERLLIPRTLISSVSMQHIGLLDKLVELDVQSLRQLTDLNALRNLTALRVLSVQDNLLTNHGCAPLRCMPSLQRLNLASCRCLSSLAAVVGSNGKWAQHLYSLNLSHTMVNDEGLQCIQQCVDLRYLNLAQCSDVQALSFLQKMTSLRWLHVGGTRVSEEEADRYLPCARALRLLSLSGCNRVRSLRFATKLPQLEYLDVEATGITDDQLIYLCKCRKLRFLSLQHCSSVSNLDPLATLPSVLELNVSMTAYGSASTVPGSASNESDGRGSARSTSPSSPNVSSPAQSVPSATPPPSLANNVTAGAAGTLGTADSSGSGNAVTLLMPAKPPTDFNVCFATIQVLHLSGCTRLKRWDTFSKRFPRLRVLYADRVSFITPSRLGSNVGVGFSGVNVEEWRRSRLAPSRPRGVRRLNVSVSEGEEEEGGGGIGSRNPPTANKSASQLDQVLQQYVPQPPVAPRPRTAHAAMARPHSPHVSAITTMATSVNSNGAEKEGGSVAVCGRRARVAGVAGEAAAAWVLRLVVRRSSVTDRTVGQLCITFGCVTCLDLTRCVEVQALPGIGELYALKELYLSQSSADDGGVRAVSACVSLEVLWLTECRNVTDVNALSALTRLRVLCMDRTQVTNEGFEGIGGCVSLQFLSCSDCHYLSDVNTLGSLKQLVELHLELTHVRDAGIRGVLKCSALQRVYFTRCQRLTTVGEMRAVLPQLEVLDVYGTSIPSRVAGQGQQFACVAM